MAHIVDPYNLDTDDDAVFAGLLMQGLVWIEDDDDDYVGDVLEVAGLFIGDHEEEWVNFSRLCRHLHETFGKLDLERLGQPNKKYKSFLKFFADYPSSFDLRQDDEKNGLYWIRLKETY